MRTCPQCNFHNLDDRETCLKCGAALAHRPGIAAQVGRMRRHNLLAGVQRKTGQLRRRTARALQVPLPENLPHRFPFVAAFLSLVPGLGQLYNHQPKKLLYLLPAFAVALALAVQFITTPYAGNIFIACAISVVMISFSDALLTAARINGQYFTFRNTLAAMIYPFALLGLFGCLCAIMAFLQWPLFTLFYAGHDHMRPAINKGDRICGEGLTYWFRQPRPGDVVRYDPPRFVIEISNTRWIINPQNGWERVMAVGGETLERRDREYYVDGKRLSPAYYPLVNDQMYANFKIVCPPGKIIVLASSCPNEGDFINRLQGMKRIPRMNDPGVILEGWEEACIVGKKDVRDRSWFRYHPSARRRFFQARGPRFVEQ